MKILHIITGLNDGGAEAVLYRLCTHDHVYQHHVVSLMDAGKYGPMLTEAGVPVTCLNMKQGKVSVRGLWKLWRLIRKLQPDAIQTWMYHADLLGGVTARLAGQRNIVWGNHHTTLDPAESPRSTILVAKACARLSRIVPRRIICCAKKSFEVHAELGYDRARMRVVPNGYDLSIFQQNPTAGLQLRQELELSPTEPVIGFVARFDPQKDHANLLNALSILKAQGDYPKCLLIGTGLDTQTKDLVDEIAVRGLNDDILLLGRRNDIPSVMNALDLHIMSSAFGEAFPNVLSEAMACGTPCVSTDVGDAAAIIGDTGRIVPTRNPQALADAITDLLTERQGPDWEQRREAARRHVSENFSIKRMVESYHETWFS
ncbi:glycosyltransferase family 4 protein [Celeribacter sp.]|uniref:glycosyltransferase family 4 protein n=1 Tax=Celeribacter sp. TaxID=1890673 RepID=UPI003A94CDBF